MVARGPGNSIQFTGRDQSFASGILAAEIDALNAEMQVSTTLTVIMENCGEANAFYDPQDRAIIFCTEFEAHLRALAEDL